jgi:hypothetical protein
MPVPGCRQCFECNATFPVSAEPGATPVVCPHDGSPLAIDVAGRRWRIEAVLGPRKGGGVFIAHHLITGVRAAVSLLYDARAGEMEERLNREVQAQRLLEPHPNLFKLLELGSERDGTRFYVSELLTEQTLRDALREWRRPTDAGTLFSQAGTVLRPLLGLLSTGQRLGIAHGELDMSQIYVALADAHEAAEPQLVRPRLYGLRRFGGGVGIVEAARADLEAVGRILFELVFGEPARQPFTPIQRAAVKSRFGDAVGSFVLRALGAPFSDGEGGFPSIDEMQRSLNALRREISTVNVNTPPGVCVPIDPLFDRTDPTVAPSRMSDRRLVTGREATAGSATPLPELPPVPGPLGPQRSGFSGELRQVSFADLLVLPQPPSASGVMARGRYQNSLPDQLPPPVRSRPARFEAPPIDDVEIEVVDESVPLPRAVAVAAGGAPALDMTSQRPGSPDIVSEPTQPPTMPHRAQSAKFKLWGWWKR